MTNHPATDAYPKHGWHFFASRLLGTSPYEPAGTRVDCSHPSVIIARGKLCRLRMLAYEIALYWRATSWVTMKSWKPSMPPRRHQRFNQQEAVSYSTLFKYCRPDWQSPWAAPSSQSVPRL